MDSIGSIAKPKRPHLLIIPFEEEAHFGIVLDLVYYLCSPDITVTFCVSHRRVVQLQELHSKGEFKGLDLHLVELSGDDVSKSSVEPPDDISIPGPVRMLLQVPKILKRQFQAYREILLAETNPAAKPTCLITDSLLDWSEELAEQLQIPRYFIYACPGWIPYMMFKTKVEKWSGPPAPDEMVEVGGFSIPAKEVPFIVCKLARVENVAGHIVNGFEEAEGADTMAAIRRLLPHLTTKPGAKVGKYFAIGPTKHILVNRSVTTNSAAAESEALKWLDKQAAASVVYVAFGTIANPPPNLLFEVARGLEMSGVPFLWVLRIPGTSTASILPPGFLDRIAKQGFIETNYAPQTLILQHPSIGGFVSHCGNNSIMEGVLAGVPFLAWPFHGDQLGNSRFLVEKLKAGIFVRPPGQGAIVPGLVIPGEEIASAIKQLMFDPIGDEVRKNSAHYKDAAQSAVNEGGSTFRNLKELADDLHTV